MGLQDKKKIFVGHGTHHDKMHINQWIILLESIYHIFGSILYTAMTKSVIYTFCYENKMGFGIHRKKLWFVLLTIIDYDFNMIKKEISATTFTFIAQKGILQWKRWKLRPDRNKK